MAMVVKNNMSAVSTLNTLNKNSSALQKSLSKVSSGMKINSAQDDASGYAISERMRVQIRSLDQANQNTQNGSSMMKTAEGAVSSTVEILKSLKEKAINAANDTNKDADRVTIQKEIDQFIDQIDDNALTTFNGKYLVDGSKSQQGVETYTAMTNQSLATGTEGTTALTKLANRNDESLEIASTDYVTASFVQNGTTYTTKWNVGTDTKLEDVFNKLNAEYTAQTNDTDTKIFGAANIPATGASTMDSDTAIGKMTDATVAALADALKNGANATTGSDVYAAATYLNGEGINAATAGLATTSAASGTVATAITNAAGAVQTNVAGTAITASETVVATATFGTTSTDTKLDATQATTAWTDTATADLSAAAGDMTNAFLDEIKSGMDSGTDVTGSATLGSSTAVTFTAKTGYTIDAADSSVNVADSSTAGVEAYAKAYAYETLVTGTVGGDLVHKGSDIGLNASKDLVYTADGEEGLTVTAGSKGIAGQVSGLTISITDSEGNVKKAANAALDAFSTTIYAKNKSDRNELSFQVGAAANQAIAVGLEDMRSEALGLKGSDGTKVSVATQDKANAAVAVFDNAIQKALDQQTTIGSIEARLEYTSQNLTTSSENVQAAESTIRDADMAKEMTNYTKNNVLLQAAQSMLAQANQSSSAVLSLLQ